MFIETPTPANEGARQHDARRGGIAAMPEAAGKWFLAQRGSTPEPFGSAGLILSSSGL